VPKISNPYIVIIMGAEDAVAACMADNGYSIAVLWLLYF
jgi:hypothetical protein